jgi:hypothetical protein
MVRLLNILKATSRAAETTPVGYFFNHLSGSNVKGEAAGTHPKISRAIHARLDPLVRSLV